MPVDGVIMESKLPEMTIIATVRNEVDSISTFVDSLLQQSLKPCEIIIVDGVSTDGTTEILQKYADEMQIVLIVQDTNIAEGRNIAIDAASNECVAVTDAGCVVDKDWLLNLARCFASLEHPDVVAGNFSFVCESVFEEAVVKATFSPNRDDTDGAVYYPSSRSVAFKKSAWREAKGYPEWLYAAEDTLFSVRLRQLGFRFMFAKDAVVRWRPRENWRALARQRLNFSRGNARVGIGTQGYIINLKYHALIFLFLLFGFAWGPLALIGLVLFGLHVKKNLWQQASQTGNSDLVWRTLLVMEYVRLVNMIGFLQGRFDRIRDPSFVSRQKEWMGVGSLDELIETNR